MAKYIQNVYNNSYVYVMVLIIQIVSEVKDKLLENLKGYGWMHDFLKWIWFKNECW